MVAYQAEGDPVRMLAPHYSRAADEGRTLVPSALASAADIEIAGDELRVTLVPLNSPHRSRAIQGHLKEACHCPFPAGHHRDCRRDRMQEQDARGSPADRGGPEPGRAGAPGDHGRVRSPPCVRGIDSGLWSRARKTLGGEQPPRPVPGRGHRVRRAGGVLLPHPGEGQPVARDRPAGEYRPPLVEEDRPAGSGVRCLTRPHDADERSYHQGACAAEDLSAPGPNFDTLRMRGRIGPGSMSLAVAPEERSGRLAPRVHTVPQALVEPSAGRSLPRRQVPAYPPGTERRIPGRALSSADHMLHDFRPFQSQAGAGVRQ